MEEPKSGLEPEQPMKQPLWPEQYVVYNSFVTRREENRRHQFRSFLIDVNDTAKARAMELSHQTTLGRTMPASSSKPSGRGRPLPMLRGLPLRRTGRSLLSGSRHFPRGRRSARAEEEAPVVRGAGGGGVRGGGGGEGEAGRAGDAGDPRCTELGTPLEAPACASAAKRQRCTGRWCTAGWRGAGSRMWPASMSPPPSLSPSQGRMATRLALASQLLPACRLVSLSLD